MKRKYTYLIVLFLIVASCAAFGRIAFNEFIILDDGSHITKNIYIQSGFNLESIKWAFTSVDTAHWHPLTFLSHTLDWSLFGPNATGHHLVSLLLHIGAVIFLFLFLNKTTNNIWSSAFCAALFALHPLRVESVAWAANRKDVLSMFFGMATLYTYAFYAESNRLPRYFLCLILFAFSLMSKPIIVTLPFVLLLLDYWPLRRWPEVTDRSTNNRLKMPAKLIWEKVPFIGLTIAISIVAFWTQNKAELVASIDSLPLITRVANAIDSYVAYLGKIFWPVNLAIYYPYNFHLPLWRILIYAICLIALTFAVMASVRKLPFLFTGWLWYLGTLFPVIGIVQVADYSRTDRYTYLPSIGIAIMLSWTLPLLFPDKKMRKKILFPAALTIMTILMVVTWKQCGYWKNDIELFNHALHVTKDNYFAHSYLAQASAKDGKIAEAIDHCNNTIRLNPYYPIACLNRGIAYAQLGLYQRALNDFNHAISLNPHFSDAFNSRGLVYVKLGRHQQALHDFNRAISLNPSESDAYLNRATVYVKLGQYQKAINDYNRINPVDADAFMNRGTVFYKLGRYQQAITDYNHAIRLQPGHADAYNNRGLAYGRTGHYQQAIDDFDEAIRLKPNFADAYNNRAYAHFLQSNKSTGCLDAQKACSLGMCKLFKFAKSKKLCR